MKYPMLYFALLAPLMLVFAFKGATPQPDVDGNCVVKINSEWGGACKNYGNSEDKYTAELQNDCEIAVDFMICLQNENKTWSCFYRNDFAPKETMKASVCKGTGKILKWARKAGDQNTVFLTEAEVNETYGN
ncbi:MAG: hypothetical protein ACFB10_15815 [Salibacteraceae bacterium]